MEKMLANGYDSGLVDAPDFTTGVKRLNLPHRLIFRLSARSPPARFGRQSGLATRTRQPALVPHLSSDQIAPGIFLARLGLLRRLAEWSKLERISI